MSTQDMNRFMLQQQQQQQLQWAIHRIENEMNRQISEINDQMTNAAMQNEMINNQVLSVNNHNAFGGYGYGMW